MKRVGHMNVLVRVGQRLCRNSGTRSENFFYIFLMGCCIGMILGTVKNPWWMQGERAPAVWYAFGTVLMCAAKLLIIRVMIEFSELD